jgi:hypothetical protein
MAKTSPKITKADQKKATSDGTDWPSASEYGAIPRKDRHIAEGGTNESFKHSEKRGQEEGPHGPEEVPRHRTRTPTERGPHFAQDKAEDGRATDRGRKG